jgi:hypothetical protein
MVKLHDLLIDSGRHLVSVAGSPVELTLTVALPGTLPMFLGIRRVSWFPAGSVLGFLATNRSRSQLNGIVERSRYAERVLFHVSQAIAVL